MAKTEKTEFIIVGLDPGSLKTGFGVVEVRGNDIRHVNHGVILLADEAGFPERLLALSDSLKMILKKYEVSQIVIEKMFLGKSAESAFKLGHARGVVMAEAARSGAQIFEYATRAVKKSVAGTGAASKEEVQKALMSQLRLRQIVNLDASDALALAVHHAQEWRTQLKILKMKE